MNVDFDLISFNIKQFDSILHNFYIKYLSYIFLLIFIAYTKYKSQRLIYSIIYNIYISIF